MSEDFQNELRFLGMESSPAYVPQPEGNGCIERFFRTLKEQMLWLRTFTDLAELRHALTEFRHRYNNGWILERLQYRTPAQTRRDFSVDLCRAACSMTSITPNRLSTPSGPIQTPLASKYRARPHRLRSATLRKSSLTRISFHPFESRHELRGRHDKQNELGEFPVVTRHDIS